MLRFYYALTHCSPKQPYIEEYRKERDELKAKLEEQERHEKEEAGEEEEVVAGRSRQAKPPRGRDASRWATLGVRAVEEAAEKTFRRVSDRW